MHNYSATTSGQQRDTNLGTKAEDLLTSGGPLNRRSATFAQITGEDAVDTSGTSGKHPWPNRESTRGCMSDAHAVRTWGRQSTDCGNPHCRRKPKRSTGKAVMLGDLRCAGGRDRFGASPPPPLKAVFHLPLSASPYVQSRAGFELQECFPDTLHESPLKST